MTVAVLDLKQWGNNLGVRLPAAVAKAGAPWRRGDGYHAGGGRAVVRKGQSAKRSKKTWAPDRQDVIWIDCNPQVGGEVRDVHPFFVLSPRAFNERTSLVIGLPMTTAAYNADNPFAVALGPAAGRKTGISDVLCHQPKSFDWRLRRARPHPRGRVSDPSFAEARARLSQILQLDD